MPVELLRNLVVLLLAIPVAAAVVVALLGSRPASAIRWLSLAATGVSCVLAVVLAVDFARLRMGEAEPAAAAAQAATFHPAFVPGAPAVTPDGHGQSREDSSRTTWDLVRFGNGSQSPAVQFYVGLDGLNVWLVLLTAVLMVSAVLVSWRAIQERTAEYYAWLLTLETGMLGVFLSFDIILFYVFFELTLVPLFFLIGIWGGPQRRYAARKFFIYTLAGSVITLLGVLGVILACDLKTNRLTFSIPELVKTVQSQRMLDDPAERAFWSAVPSTGKIVRSVFGSVTPEEAAGMWGGVEFWVFLALMAGFAVKVPLVPLHTWLPLAHVEAPTAGSVLLAGVLLKIGAYGFLRLCLPLAPDASLVLGVPLVGALAVIGIVYGALCAYAQSDIKRLVAYSSVSHLGFCMLGMFALNAAGLTGSLLQMVNHGLSTGALFLLVGMLYERYHTRMSVDYGGLAARLPLLACFAVFISLASIGLPGLNGFVGEILVLMGIFDFERARGSWPVLAVVGATGIVLGAWYLLTMLGHVFFGAVKEPEVHARATTVARRSMAEAATESRTTGTQPRHENHTTVRDLSVREMLALAPIAALCLLIGVYPQPFIDTMNRDIGIVAGIVHSGVERSSAAPSRQSIHELADRDLIEERP